MATSSFFRPLVISTEEELDRFENAIKNADNYIIPYLDTEEMARRSEALLRQCLALQNSPK